MERTVYVTDPEFKVEANEIAHTYLNYNRL